MRPAALLFDMDGLLLNSERLFMQPFLEKAREIGIDQTEAEAFFVSLVGTNAKVTHSRLKEFLPTDCDAAEFESDWRARYAILTDRGVPVMPGVSKVLSNLSDIQIPKAVVTSTDGVTARKKLKKSKIIQHFDLIKAGDEVSANKPDPAPYLEAAEALGVSPSQCVAFEDSDLGTQSARAAGCITYQIPDLRPLGKPLPDLGQRVAATLGEAFDDLGLCP